MQTSGAKFTGPGQMASAYKRECSFDGLDIHSQNDVTLVTKPGSEHWKA